MRNNFKNSSFAKKNVNIFSIQKLCKVNYYILKEFMDTNSDDSAKKNIAIVKIKSLRKILIYLCLNIV